jgi:hypothetical protein
LLFALLSLLVLPILGLLVWIVLRKVLHLRLWFIVVLFLGACLLLHFAVLSTLFRGLNFHCLANVCFRDYSLSYDRLAILV